MPSVESRTTLDMGPLGGSTDRVSGIRDLEQGSGAGIWSRDLEQRPQSRAEDLGATDTGQTESGDPLRGSGVGRAAVGDGGRGSGVGGHFGGWSLPEHAGHFLQREREG